MERYQIIQEIIELEQKCGSILDAIITICEKYSIEIETISTYLRNSRDIKERLQLEGENLHFLSR